VLLSISNAAAQGVQTGTLRGFVTGPDGAPVPNAEITVSSPAMQGPRTTSTDEAGGYALYALPPGEYAVRVVVSGAEVAQQQARVPLGGVAEVHVRMRLANVREAVTVVAPVLTTPAANANYTHAQIDALATPRTLSGIARFAPGVSDAVATPGPTEGQGQVSIHGGLGYDNVFLVDGVDVNDNIFGWPQNLFIEDAIAETQVLTSGVSAEYGRFGGGVVNAITKSGGNTYSGSVRVTFSNDAWSTETPFEVSRNVQRQGKVNAVHEGTLGGPIVRDRVWFFLAGRYANVETTPTLPVTGATYTTSDRNERGEVKVTATAAPGHTVQASALGNPRTQERQANFTGGLSTIDPRALSDKERPNHLLGVGYRGVLGGRVLADAQYSHQQFSTNAGGGTSTALADSPFITLDFTQQYNAPYFSAADPDRRNNRQLTASAASLLPRHELKAGYEWFRSQKIGGNSPSSTGFVFQADYAVGLDGLPRLDSQGRLIPVFDDEGGAYVWRFLSTPGAELNVDHHSFYAQDHWTVGSRLSADLGIRLEQVSSTGTGASSGVDAFRALPRLGAAFDLTGAGRYVVQGTYAHYSNRYSDALLVRNSAVGNPNEVDGIYVGPEGEGVDFAPGFDLANYEFGDEFASFPTANVRFDPELASPLTRELTAGAGARIGGGSVQGSYVWRRTRDLIEDFVTLANGTTDVDDFGLDLTLTNRVYRNTDLAQRDYQGLVLQGDYGILGGLRVNGHWTVQLENHGNYEGEAPNQIVPSVIGDYPEIFTESRHYPRGRLPGFQRHKVHLWGVYALDLGRAGDATLSGLWRYNSARTYSLRATQGLSLTQFLTLVGAGYPDGPGRQTVYFDELGSEAFEGYGLFDVSASYDVPVFRGLRPWIKADVFNLLNNQKLIAWNTSIAPDSSTPLDALGLRTGYSEGSQFGRATGNTSFPVPFAGATGGRTLRLAVGLRF
jgi:hypothetical protein